MNDFDRFWEIYPRREGKKVARKCFAKALLEATADEIIAGARVYSEMKADTETRFVKLASTWLNGENWNDEFRPDPDPDQKRIDDGRRALLDSVGIKLAGSGPSAGRAGRVH